MSDIKMVIIYTNAGEKWFTGAKDDQGVPSPTPGFPWGGSRVPTCRYIIEEKAIKGEILQSAPLPPGHEKEAVAYYMRLLFHYLDPASAANEGNSLEHPNVLERIGSPERDIEGWLKGLCTVYPMISPYTFFSQERYKAMDSQVMERYKA